MSQRMICRRAAPAESVGARQACSEEFERSTGDGRAREEAAGFVNDGAQPPVTFALLAYNQEEFIGEAVEGAFAQEWRPLEIILSDDCSSDRTFAIMERVAGCYRGPHTLVLNRNERNLGIGMHLNGVAAQATGEWLVVAAGDDISHPKRVEALMRSVTSAGASATAAFSAAEVFLGPGGKGRPETLRLRQPTLRGAIDRSIGVSGATAAYRRRLFEFFGPLDAGLSYEDIVLCVRALLLGTVVVADEALVQYRRHEGAHSAHGYGKSGDGLRAHHTRVTLEELRAYANILRDLGTYAAKRGVADPAWRVALQAVSTAIAERDAWLDVTLDGSVTSMVARQLRGAAVRFVRSLRLWASPRGRR